MRLRRKHDAQNRGKREQRTTRNKNTVIHGVGIAAIRNRRATWRGTCRSPTAQQPRRKPDTVSGRARKTRKWRWMQPTRLPGDRRSGGRRSRIPVRTGCGRQENESPHPQCHPAFFTPHAHPGKSKTSPERTSIPSLNRAGIPAIPIINSSNSVERRPSGSSRGTGEKSFPHAEYCGTRLESPPE